MPKQSNLRHAKPDVQYESFGTQVFYTRSKVVDNEMNKYQCVSLVLKCLPILRITLLHSCYRKKLKPLNKQSYHVEMVSSGSRIVTPKSSYDNHYEPIIYLHICFILSFK